MPCRFASTSAVTNESKRWICSSTPGPAGLRGEVPAGPAGAETAVDLADAAHHDARAGRDRALAPGRARLRERLAEDVGEPRRAVGQREVGHAARSIC